MRHFLILAAALALQAAPALADDGSSRLSIGGDTYVAGSDAVSGAVSGDLFAAGATVTVDQPVGGAAHLAGRRLAVEAPVSGGLYAAGYSIDIDSAITGGASLFGSQVAVNAPVTGNIRILGADVTLSAPVEGAALLTGSELRLDAPISGDVIITAEEVSFGSGATVAGTLTLYVDDTDDVTVPERVAPADRVSIREIEEVQDSVPELRREVEAMGRRGLAAIVANILTGVVVVALDAAAAVAIAPETVAHIRARALAAPGTSILAGFVAMSALVGAAVVLALTLVGLPLVPLAILVAALLIFAGYVAGSYILGVGIWTAFGKAIPVHVPQKAALAMLGAAVAGLVFLVPFIGWLAWFALVFLGLGAIAAPLLGRFAGFAARG